MNRKVITSLDVAKLAHVSQSAVSRAFTPGASVAPETRERILNAADELGYRPNAIARAMISGRSKLIALLVSYMENQYYPVIVDRISRRLKAEGYGVLLLIPDPCRQDNHVAEMMQYQVDGLIVASSSVSESVQNCADCGVPVVSFNRILPSSPAISVCSDNVAGGRMVADLLIKSGCQRISYIAGTETSSAILDRERGFNRGMAAHGKVVFGRTVLGDRRAPAKSAARALFDREEIPDAVFVANDHMAIAVMDVLRDELQLRIPQDVSIVGFDDVPEASLSAYNLTTVSQNVVAIVDSILEILLHQIDSQEITEIAKIVPVRLVARGTVKLASVNPDYSVHYNIRKK